MKQHLWWIKERYNPQIGIYYVASGQMSKTAANKHKQPLYGRNKMHPYKTEEEYRKAIEDLKKEGERVR
jgi:hypothetical protein